MPTPISWWRIDDARDIAVDHGSDPHDGQVQGGTVWTAGQLNGSLAVDGISGHVEVEPADSYHLTERFTLAAWMAVLAPRP